MGLQQTPTEPTIFSPSTIKLAIYSTHADQQQLIIGNPAELCLTQQWDICTYTPLGLLQWDTVTAYSSNIVLINTILIFAHTLLV